MYEVEHVIQIYFRIWFSYWLNSAAECNDQHMRDDCIVTIPTSPLLSDYDTSCSLWAKDVGVVIGKMHDADVVHGDLTTSNIMV